VPESSAVWDECHEIQGAEQRHELPHTPLLHVGHPDTLWTVMVMVMVMVVVMVMMIESIIMMRRVISNTVTHCGNTVTTLQQSCNNTITHLGSGGLSELTTVTYER
jgi:hypothetical protein